MLADVVLQACGVGAYYLLASMAVLDIWLLFRRPVTDPILRSVGWLLSLVALCTLSSMSIAGWSPGPVIGPGGFIGASGRAAVGDAFRQRRHVILVISLLVGGLLLSTEYLLPRLVGVIFASIVGGVSRMLPEKAARPVKKQRRNTRTDLETPVPEADDEAEEPAIRIGGKSAKPDEETEEAEDEAKDSAESEAEGEESAEGEDTSESEAAAEGDSRTATEAAAEERA